MQKYFQLTLLCWFSIVGFSVSADSKSNNQEKLSKVKQAISAEKNKISTKQQEKNKLERALKADDLAIAEIAKKLNTTKKQLQKITNTIAELSQQKQQLTYQKQQQEKLLAKQLRAVYSSGEYDYLKLLLNQEDTTSIQRSITYYQYFNDARIKEIETFKSTLSRLLEVVSAHQEQSATLEKVKQQQLNQQKTFIASKTKRSKTVAQLNAQLKTSQQKLNKYIAEEENLIIEIDRLTKLAKRSLKLKGLSKLKGKLKWPSKGRISRSYGSRKEGYLTWKGVLLSLPSGRTVKSIHHGKVLFADWLKGYGLVTIVDHGQGYMSLYGHNQALMKSVGDMVEAGEPIALSGQSGGQAQSGVYFEIRYQGKPVNPKTWCR